MIAVLASISLILALAIILIVAYHLIGIYQSLKRAADDLEKLAGGLAKIRDNTKPLNGKIETINGGLNELVAPLLGAGGNLAAIVKVAKSA
jgi:cell division protein FtsB